MKSKKELRQKMICKRADMDKASRSLFDHQIVNRLIDLVKERDYQIIHCYISMPEELNTWPFLEYCLSNNIKVYTPKTLKKRKLEHLQLKSLSELEKGVYGTLHPKAEHPYDGEYDLIIVPGLAFDLSGYRLGYGGGYYDHFLGQHPTALKIGVCYPFQLVPVVPTESHDVQLDYIYCNEEFSI